MFPVRDRWKVKNKWILVSLFVVDRLIKLYAVSSGDFYLNQGVSFGMIKTQWWIVLGFLMLLLAVKFWSQSRGVGLIFVGGLSNWLDRIQYGGVVDMFNGYFFWFNMADVIITIGVIVLIYESLYERKI